MKPDKFGWARVREFPGYSVHYEGFVRNDETERIMAVTENQGGTTMVGMTRDGVQYRRSIGLLVATAFLPQPADARFDTPIHLNGDGYDNHIENLAWRPKWFASKYRRQFRDDPSWRINKDIYLKSDPTKVWANSWDCARCNGLLEIDLVGAIVRRTYVFPNYEEYEVVGY